MRELFRRGEVLQSIHTPHAKKHLEGDLVDTACDVNASGTRAEMQGLKLVHESEGVYSCSLTR